MKLILPPPPFFLIFDWWSEIRKQAMLLLLMSLLTFLIGFTLGRLVHERKTEDRTELGESGSVQFLEGVTNKEKFNNAKVIDDLLN